MSTEPSAEETGARAPADDLPPPGWSGGGENAKWSGLQELAQMPAGPVTKLIASEGLLEGARAGVEAGDGVAALHCLAICFIEEIEVPDWLSSAYLRHYGRVSRHECASWDEAFGRPFPKNTPVGVERQRQEQMRAVVDEAFRLKRAGGAGSGKAFWSAVGSVANCEATKAEQLYGRAVKLGFAPPFAELSANLPATSGKAAGSLRRR